MHLYRHIVIGTDLSSDAKHCIQETLQLATRYQARLSLLHVIDDQVKYYQEILPLAPSELEEMLLQETRRMLLEQYGEDALPFEVHVRFGKPHDGLIAYAQEEEADLIVVGPRTSSLIKRMFLGSTAEKLLRYNPLPTLIVHPEKTTQFRKILVPVDMSEASRQALQHACQMTRAEQAELHILHICEETPIASLMGMLPIAEVSGFHALYEQTARTAFEEFLTQIPLKDLQTQIHFKHGTAAQEILACAQAISSDLLIMGAIGRTGLTDAILGSTTERIVRDLPCSLLAIHPHSLPHMHPQPYPKPSA